MEESLKNELQDLPLQDLVKLREKVGCNTFKDVIGGSCKLRRARDSRTFYRESKSGPLEISSKVKSKGVRKVLPVSHKVVRDPRFDDMSGEFNEHIFKSSYSFLDGIKVNELEKVKKEIKRTKNAEKKKQLHKLLERMENKNRATKDKETKRDLDNVEKKEAAQALRKGKAPVFLNKGEKKKVLLAKKFRELKSQGKLQKYLTKKRKKIAGKEKKNMDKLERISKDLE